MGRTSALRFSGSALSPMPTSRGSSTSPMTPPGSSHSPMTHGRGIPSPELAVALRRSRSGIFREGDDTLYRKDLTTTVRSHHCWEAQVRIDNGVAALMSGLSFTEEPLGPGWSHGTTPLIHLKAPDVISIKVYQLPMVLSASDQRDDRLPEILTQAEGLWPFWTSITNIDAALAPATVELIETLLQTTHLMVMRMKYALGVPRPVDLSSTLGPVIPTPGHGSFPSGHSTVAFMFSAFMHRLLSPLSADDSTIDCLGRVAHRIAQNRVVAGVHFPVDSVAGRLVGETLAEYFYARCVDADDGVYADAQFDAAAISAARVNIDDEPNAGDFENRVTKVGQVRRGKTLKDPVLQTMWNDATTELSQLGLK